MSRTFVGTAAVHGERYKIGSGDWAMYEEIMPGAFDRALRDRDDVRLLVDHDPSLLLGRTSSGTLRLRADRQGLHATADLPDTQLARDTIELLERRDLTQMSFAWGREGTREEWGETADGKPLVRVHSVGTLWDVSIVTYPAYLTTSAGLTRTAEQVRRKLDEALRKDFRRLEHKLHLEEQQRRRKEMIRQELDLARAGLVPLRPPRIRR